MGLCRCRIFYNSAIHLRLESIFKIPAIKFYAVVKNRGNGI